MTTARPFVYSPLRSRHSFGRLLNSLGLSGEAVEIGTHEGSFAGWLLFLWMGKRVYCVDPYCSDYNDLDPLSHLSQAQRERDYKTARDKLAFYDDRVKFLRSYSVEAARDFPDASLDFVYIDGDHSRLSVETDVKTWWPKVKPKGVLAGHDYFCTDPGFPWTDTVRPVVDAFTSENDLQLYVVKEQDESPWSWYVIKPTLSPSGANL